MKLFVDFWKFTKNWNGLQHRNKELFLIWCLDFQKSTDNPLPFDGIFQDNIGLSDIYWVVLPKFFFVNFISGLTWFWTFVRNETYLESSIKMRSFLSQWMAAFGSEATKQANCKGSPSIKATSFGFSRKNGTTPSMTSFSMVSCNDFYIELIKTVEIFLQGSKYFLLNKGIIIRTRVKLFGWIVLPHLTIPLYDY